MTHEMGPGWYQSDADPRGTLRWWDGASWTARTAGRDQWGPAPPPAGDSGPAVEIREYRASWEYKRGIEEMEADGWSVLSVQTVRVRRPARHMLLFGMVLYWVLPKVTRYRVTFLSGTDPA